MFRDFSSEAREQLKQYAKDATPTDWIEEIEDAFSDFGTWVTGLSMSEYKNDVSSFHQKVVDYKDTTTDEIDIIFNNVIGIDGTYGGSCADVVAHLKNIVKTVNDLADCIDPNGGNLSVEHMTEVMEANLQKLADSHATVAENVEESMLGAAEAAEMSADPVNLSTGNFIYDHEDLYIGGEIPLSFHRYYNSKDKRSGALGKCFLHNYDIAIEVRLNDEIGVRLSDGQFHHFEKTTDGKYIGKTIAVEDLEKTETGYRLVTPGRERKFFDEDGKILRQENWFGRGITFAYNESGLLAEAVTSLPGAFMQGATNGFSPIDYLKGKTVLNSVAESLMTGFDDSSASIINQIYGAIDNGLIAADSTGNLFDESFYKTCEGKE